MDAPTPNEMGSIQMTAPETYTLFPPESLQNMRRTEQLPMSTDRLYSVRCDSQDTSNC